jgi:hypothetical protein
VRILLRADSGFAREELMAWCEANGAHFLFGLAQNTRLVAMIADELAQAEAKSRRTGKAARYFEEFRWQTRRSRSRERRVIAKAEFTGDEANPRFVVTSLTRSECKPKYLDADWEIYTLTFNVNPGTSLGKAIERIRMAESELRLPATVRSSFDGQAQAFQSSATSIPILILTAVTVVYIVLGVLYESYIHPLTILSTIPTAGLGALLALLACRLDLSLVASIGIILLIGIVTKNAIMVVDFALEAQRQGRASEEAIMKASLLRFRPIFMTTIAAALGPLPFALAAGAGSEFYEPIGVTITGGLLISQLLTIYTTPVIYLCLDTLHRRSRWLLP